MLRGLFIFLCTIPFQSFSTILHIEDYSISVIGHAHAMGDDLDVDKNGNLYIPNNQQTEFSGVYKMLDNGTMSLWSEATGNSLAISNSGEAFLTNRGWGHDIFKIDQDGIFSNLVDTNNVAWTWLATDFVGNLFANVWAGPNSGLYAIDTSTGDYSLIHGGGPGESNNGFYFDMAFGSDGFLYTLGHDGNDYGLFKYDNDDFIKVAVLPHAGIGLTADPFGNFYTATNYGASFDEVWKISPDTNEVTLIASEFNDPSGIAYNSKTAELYVRDQTGNAIYSIQTNNEKLPITVPEPPIIFPFAFGLLAFIAKRKLLRLQSNFTANKGNNYIKLDRAPYSFSK